MRPQRACGFEKGCVAGGVIADTDVPRVDVPVQEHKPFRLDGSGDLRDEDGNRSPRLVVLGDDRRRGSAVGDRLDQLEAVAIGD